MSEPPVLLLLTGLLSDEVVWEAQARVLDDLAVIRIMHFRGFGDIPRMAEAVLEVAPERFSLAGHSMGGRVALEVFRHAADRIVRLGLFNTGIYPAHEKEASERNKLVRIAREEGMAALAEAWVPTVIHPDRLNDAQLVSALAAMAERNTPEQFENQIGALVNRPDMRDLLPKIACPTMVLAGRDDAWASVNQHIEMSGIISSANLSIIEHCGHMTTMERPDEVSGLMREWMMR